MGIVKYIEGGFIVSEDRNVNRDNVGRGMTAILFWGSIWGIVEATIGYLLHALPFKVPTGTFFFPLGCYFMYRAYEGTKSEQSAFYTASIAAAIKLVNLFIPGTPVIRVINPAISILFEGLTVFLAFKIFAYRGGRIGLLKALGISMAWRAIYIVYLLITLPQAYIPGSAIDSFARFGEFFIRNSLINSLIIYLYARFFSEQRADRPQKAFHPAISISIFTLAIFIQWVT